VAEGIKEVLHPLRKKYHQEFWALRDVSFEVKRGESVGIVGRNGSGKSTLLQIICGIMQPTEGQIKVNGKVSALLELGAGFHPLFTGRENVYLNGALMGLKKEEIDERLPSILEFADIGDFIDQPVRTYSSGMFVRLAFSVAISVEPDILVIDEILGVGDVTFQVKCMDRINMLRKKGVTILFVTQEPNQIKKFCDWGLWLHQGRPEKLGDPVKVADSYLDFIRRKSGGGEESARIKESKLPCLISVDMVDRLNKPKMAFKYGETAKVRLRYRVPETFDDSLILGVALYRNDDCEICALNTSLDGFAVNASPGDHELLLEFPRLNLLSGTYYLKAGVIHSSSMVSYDFNGYALDFTITTPYKAEGIVVLEHQWKQGEEIRKLLGNG